MLCSVAVRRNVFPDEQGCSLVLRLRSKPALGSAGRSSGEDRGFPDEASLLQQLQALHLPDDVLRKASACVSADAQTDHFVTIGSDIQIVFSLLEEQGFYLFD